MLVEANKGRAGQGWEIKESGKTEETAKRAMRIE